jgi:hypothetical protein
MFVGGVAPYAMTSDLVAPAEMTRDLSAGSESPPAQAADPGTQHGASAAHIPTDAASCCRGRRQAWARPVRHPIGVQLRLLCMLLLLAAV